MDSSDELLKEAKEKGIRITYIDSYTKEKLQDLTVATDNVNAGRMLGEYARKLIDKDSKIAIVSHVKVFLQLWRENRDSGKALVTMLIT